MYFITLYLFLHQQKYDFFKINNFFIENVLIIKQHIVAYLYFCLKKCIIDNGDFMKKKIDLRVIKTKNAIYDALINLLKDNLFEEIKVSDICKTALINRSTFYAHFEDKYDLVMSLIEDLRESLSKELNTIADDLSVKDYYLELIKAFLNHIEGKEDIYRSIMVNNRNSIIMDMVYATISDDINKRIDGLINGVPGNVVASFYLGGVVNIGFEWLKNGKTYSKEEMLEYLNKLIK